MLKRFTSLITKVAFFASLATVGSSVNAAVISFTDEASFSLSTSDSVLDTFNDLISFADGGDTLSSPLTRIIDSGSYDVDIDGIGVFIGSQSIAPSGEEYISNESVVDTITISNISGLPTYALGGFLFGSNLTPIAANLTATIFDLDGLATSLSLSCDLNPANCFFGFTSSVAIERLELSGDTNFIGLDDLRFANAAVVSAPASFYIVVLGAIALVLRRYKA
ncbi:hypothetical protein PN836_005740 [Ningiella sp. W23]|uniref:hypothetical protein n=1 Tax=Ningiella sp. W23 TaxID=3023715 RepID=UPI00375660F1